MLVAYGVATDHKTAISPLMFLHICPAMIYQLDSKDCVHNAPVMEGQEDDASISKSVVFWRSFGLELHERVNMTMWYQITHQRAISCFELTILICFIFNYEYIEIFKKKKIVPKIY